MIMKTFGALRGCKDLIFDDCRDHQFIIDRFTETVGHYNYQQIITPTIEYLDVFRRSIGDETDVVSKEMYNFTSKGGDEIALRPEFTAGLARAFVNNNLQQHLPLKVFCHGPIFRYERPQKGRQREFYQVNAEMYGTMDPLSDVEMVVMARDFLHSLGLKNQFNLLVNCLGSDQDREAYIQALKDYLEGFREELSADSQTRLLKNPLRILDSKDKRDREILVDAPKLSDFLSTDSQKNFDTILSTLQDLGIEYEISENLVRGLDYYNDLVFEFVASEEFGQNTILAGGRYNNLIGKFAKNTVAAIGWASGIERLRLITKSQITHKQLVGIVVMGESHKDYAFKLAHRMRVAGISVEYDIEGNPKKALKKLVEKNCTTAIFIGENEVKSNILTIKDLVTGEQSSVELSAITSLFGDR